MNTELNSRLVSNRLQKVKDKLIASLVFTPPSEHGAKMKLILELASVIDWLERK